MPDEILISKAAIDMGQYVIAKEKLGLALSSRDVFNILTEHQKITPELADSLQKMVGFRNIAVYEYQKILLSIVEKIVNVHLEELLSYSEIILKSNKI